MKRSLVAVLLFFLTAPAAFSQAKPTTKPVAAAASGNSDAAIQKVVDAFMAAWNKHDATALAALFTEDADFTAVRGMRAKGRSNIEAFHQQLFTRAVGDAQRSTLETSIRLIRPDVAVADVRWGLKAPAAGEAEKSPKRQGLVSMVMTRSGEQWSIVVLHNMELPAGP